MNTSKPLPTRRCRTCGGSGREPRVTGRRLRELREFAGIGLRELARLAGFTPTRISRAERGKGRPLSPGELRRYLRGIGYRGAIPRPTAPATLAIESATDEPLHYRVGTVVEPETEPEVEN